MVAAPSRAAAGAPRLGKARIKTTIEEFPGETFSATSDAHKESVRQVVAELKAKLSRGAVLVYSETFVNKVLALTVLKRNRLVL